MHKTLFRLSAGLRAGLLAAPLAFAALPAAAQAPGQMPPTGVAVITLKSQAVPVISELPGRVSATRTSEVRPRVSGILQERVFEQGSLVKQGDVLYRIDRKLFEVRVKSAEASLARAKATLLNAQQQLERQKRLRDRDVSSAVDYDSAAVAVAQAEADVAQAEATLEEARINLSYTEVKAPITGIIGAALVTEGALVSAEGSQNLATIQQIDPVYADFTQSSSELLALKRAVDQGKLESLGPGKARVQLVFDDGTLYDQPGTLLFASANVDTTTGQVTLRGEFPNPKGDLLPGLYVRVRIEQAVRQGAILIPQRAVLRTATGGAQVYVVEGDTAQPRDVTLGDVIDENWVVESGLKDGEKLVVEGSQKLQPGAKVAPEDWKPVAATNAAAPAAPAEGAAEAPAAPAADAATPAADAEAAK